MSSLSQIDFQVEKKTSSEGAEVLNASVSGVSINPVCFPTHIYFDTVCTADGKNKMKATVDGVGMKSVTKEIDIVFTLPLTPPLPPVVDLSLPIDPPFDPLPDLDPFSFFMTQLDLTQRENECFRGATLESVRQAMLADTFIKLDLQAIDHKQFLSSYKYDFARTPERFHSVIRACYELSDAWKFVRKWPAV